MTTKSSGGGKRTENPPPKTSPKVEKEAAQALRGSPSSREAQPSPGQIRVWVKSA